MVGLEGQVSAKDLCNASARGKYHLVGGLPNQSVG
jgi:hypothetical protein